MLFYSLKREIFQHIRHIIDDRTSEKKVFPLLIKHTALIVHFFVFGWLFFKVGLNVQCEKNEIKSDDVFIGNIGETSSELTQDQDQNEYDLIIAKFDNIV